MALKKTLRLLVIILGFGAAITVGARFLLPRFLKTNKSSGVTAPLDLGSVRDFSFLERNGKPVGLKDLGEKYWVANFIFTRCAGPCPLLTSKMAELQSEFKAEPRVQFVSFSVDPDYDTPPVLKIYADRYGADKSRWYFLTGDKERIFRLVEDSFHLAVADNPKPLNSARDVIHSLYFVLVGPDSKILGYYNTTDANDFERLREQLKKRF